jgi:3-oxoadipate enol-lactonase
MLMPDLKPMNNQVHFQFQNFEKEKTIVFSGSLGADLHMWDGQVEFLCRDFNVLRLDTRGLGKSPVTKQELSIADHGQDVLDILDVLELPKVYFCGLSLGGLIGQWLGIFHPERFEKIILSNTAAKIGTESSWNDRIKEVQANGLSSIAAGTADRWFTPGFRQSHEEAVAKVMDTFRRTDVIGYTANCAAVRDADFRESLHDLKVPVLVISGLQDQVTTVADSEFMADGIPECSHVSLNAAHLSNVEFAKEFSELILKFLKLENE